MTFRTRSKLVLVISVAAAVLATRTAITAELPPLPATSPANDWSQPLGSLSTRLAIKTSSVKAGEPIPIHLEIRNSSNLNKNFQRPTDPYNSVLVVQDEQGRKVPYLGGPVQAAAPQLAIGPSQDQALESFDLTQWYYLRHPGKYTVKWPGQVAHPRDPGDSSLPSTPALQFEITSNPAADADGDPVGHLLPLVKKDWQFEALQTSPTKLHPGGNRQEVVGRAFAFCYPSAPGANEKGPRIWLWLTDQSAAEQPAMSDWPPPSEYVGKVSRWHVYIIRSASGLKAWPTAKEDITQALSKEIPAMPKTPVPQDK